MKKTILFPLTVFADPFNGKYSRGNYIALNQLPKDINPVLYGNDFALNFVFWENYDECLDGVIGIGDSADEAIANLERQLQKVQKKPISENKVEYQNNSICQEMDKLKQML